MPTNIATLKEKPKPFLFPQYCKGCERCVGACPKGCIALDDGINPQTGMIPVRVDLALCNSCGLCVSACPEPYGMNLPADFLDAKADFELQDPAKLFGPRKSDAPKPVSYPDEKIPLPPMEPVVIKGTYASAIGAILAGCRHVYGYPITPSTEGAELMSKLQPLLDGVFYQAVSETATVNIMYGSGGAGVPCMTFTSSPGFSLMLEGISYMVGSEVPAVFVNVMRGGPGLGNIGPAQDDISLMCRGLGHGNTRAVVYAPSTPQEMLDLTMKAFKTAFKYRNPAIVAADGYLGQITGKVALPDHMVKPGTPDWCVRGDASHRANLINSIILLETDLEKHNIKLNEKYARMEANEAMADLYRCDEAEVLLVAANTPARMAKGAVAELRAKGVKAGLFRPVTLWPFPVEALKPLMKSVKRVFVVEASSGQLEDELRLAVDKAGMDRLPPVDSVRRLGGVLPQTGEIVKKILSVMEAAR